MDTTGLPLGERARRAILEYVVQVGDAAETSYLEIKSDIDLTRPAGYTKVAKFLLGASNRQPDVAARHFGGYAVMVLGAEAGGLKGLPTGTEPHELEDRLRPYLGPGFPVYELGRLPADVPGREVVFVFAAPPEQGQPPFPCRRNYSGEKAKEALHDGAIYVRGSSNTRPANSGEIDGLIARARSGDPRPEVDLELEVLGPVHRVEQSAELLSRLYELTEQEFRDSLERPAPPRTGYDAATEFGATRRRTVEELRGELEQWLAARTSHEVRGREHLLGVLLEGMKLAVTSRGRFIAGPQLVVVFHGCSLVEHLDADDLDEETLIEPVLGRRPDPYGVVSAVLPLPANYPLCWEVDGDSVRVTLTLDSLHPDTRWISDSDDFCVISTSDEPTVRVSWQLTEQGNDKVYRGELQVPVTGPQDAFALYRDFATLHSPADS